MSEVPTRLLRDTLRSAFASDRTPACLDAETLAAWADGTLHSRDRAVAESHAANCARCQAMLAAMARTRPPAASRKWWQPSAFGWLVPIAVGAIALIVFVNLPARRAGRSSVPVAATATAPAASSASTPLVDRADAAPEQANVPAPVMPPPAGRAGITSNTFVAAHPPATVGRRELEADASKPPRRSVDGIGADRDQLRVAAPTAPPAAEAPPAAQPLDAQALAAPPPAAPPAAATQPQNFGAAAGALAESVQLARPAAPSPSVDESRQRAAAERAAAGSRAEAMAKAIAQAPPQIVSPNSSVRWRIGVGGRVDRSIDGGATWQAQSTGAAMRLTAGAAPSASICWLVGPRGTVVLSIDGRTWQRIAFPEAIDLVSVRASDAANATVIAADGRAFVTGDGGQTWRRAPQ